MNSKKSFPIREWSKDDRPREKLKEKGRITLSNAELIAILIGSGNKNESAVALSKRILASSGNNLNTLGKLSIKQLTKFYGVGEAKAISIIAALELGHRKRAEETISLEGASSSKSIFETMQPIIGELPHEEFWIVYLNNSNMILSKSLLSKGSITGTLVDVRLVLKTALENGAVNLILSHNHPSGVLYPSESDIQITKKLKVAAESLDIKVLDHVIITNKSYYSFADEGII